LSVLLLLSIVLSVLLLLSIVLSVLLLLSIVEGSCLNYVMFGSSLPPVVCRTARVFITLCSVRLYIQLFVGGLMS
jgi:hypothetical protein